MAILTLTQAVYGLLIFLAYRIISRLHRTRSLAALARSKGCEQPHTLPGPWPGGFAGLRRIMRMKQTGEDILDDIVGDMFRKASTVQSTHLEGSTMLVTIEPANLQAMLATQFGDFEIGEQRINTFYPLLRRSIFSADGAYWEHSRALFRPQFAREQINDLEATEESCRALIRALGPVDAHGWTGEKDLQPLLFDFTLDTATAFLFGESVRSLEAHDGNGSAHRQQATTKQFKEDFELVSRYMIHRIRLQSCYWLVDGIRFRRAIARIKAFTEQFVQKAIDGRDARLAQREKHPSESEEEEGQGQRRKKKKKYDLLSALAEQTQDREELRDQTMAILAAGRDTTASLLGWCFLRLALHPTIQQTLRRAILAHFPPSQPITFTRLKECRYLQHFIHEVLRLHPTVPFNNRTAARTTTLPRGGGPAGSAPVLVPAGQTVAFSVYLLHRRRDLWGPDAAVFRPERWAESPITTTTATTTTTTDDARPPPARAWRFLPFSGGPRVCLGQQFALTEAGYVLVRVLRAFDAVRPADADAGAQLGRMRKALGLTMWPADGVRLRLHRAEGEE